MYTFLKSILLIFISVISESAQDISQMYVVGNGEYLQDVLVNKSITDPNGEVCAGLIIQSDLTGLSYDSNNGIIKINHIDGEDILFLSPNEQVVKVLKSGYKPLKIILDEYYIALKSEQLWQLKITSDTKEDVILVTIVSSPRDANVFIDNKWKGNGTTFQLREGRHQISLEMGGYKTHRKTINVSGSNTYFYIELIENNLVLVRFKSKPSGAQLYINHVEKGTTDVETFLFPGRYNIKISLSGYLDAVNNIEVEEDGKNEFEYTLSNKIATLTLNITPSDAKVLINKEDFSNQNRIKLSPGKYIIEISKDGYTPHYEVIDFGKKMHVEKSFVLSKHTGTR